MFHMSPLIALAQISAARLRPFGHHLPPKFKNPPAKFKRRFLCRVRNNAFLSQKSKNPRSCPPSAPRCSFSLPLPKKWKAGWSWPLLDDNEIDRRKYFSLHPIAIATVQNWPSLTKTIFQSQNQWKYWYWAMFNDIDNKSNENDCLHLIWQISRK